MSRFSPKFNGCGGQPQTKPRCASGFTLIETLVAIVILSLSLGVLYQAAVGATRNARVAAEYSRAIVIAESVLADSLSPMTNDLSIQGQFEDIRWSASTRELPVEGPSDSDLNSANPLLLLEVRVTWGDEDRPRDLALSTVIAGQVDQ